MAHRRELIKQAFCKLVRNGIDPRQIGIEMGNTSAKLIDSAAKPPELCTDAELWEQWARRRTHAPVQVSSIDTIRNRAVNPADTIIVDEAHRCLSASYLALVENYPTARIIGLTATPVRGVGRGLGELFEELIEVAQYSDLIADGWIVDPEILSVDPSQLPDLSGIKVKASGDYDERQLAEVVDKPRLVGHAVEHWEEYLRGVRTVAFAVSVQHSRHVAEQFRAHGHSAEHFDATTPLEERDAILARHKSGETLILSNVDVLTEGWDNPSTKGAILLRPTLSLRVYMQQGGRILRPFEGQKAVILDHAGLYSRFGSVTDNQPWTLDSPKRRRKQIAVPSVSTCPKCKGPLVQGKCEAEGCDYRAEPGEGRGMPEEQDGKLVLVQKSTSDEKREFWEALCASRGGNGPGWVHIKFLERFGTKAPKGWEVPLSEEEERAMEIEDAPKKARLRALLKEAQEKGWKPFAVQMRFKNEYGFFAPAKWLAECKPRESGMFAMMGVGA